ncbi:outer membrane beta-barrel protein [Microbulbifer hainanensis]|uniref:outer membrane beta-barrel protein n=1 Tax=Microbulbifer hainanensis TaxID=2735675 RepID=UPI001868701D|nr:outer membrane beta-barrel protein [Microbulbifer hainanensis]
MYLETPFASAAVELPAGIDLSPELSMTYQYDDNVTNSADGIIESWVIATHAALNLEAIDQVDKYRLSYSADHGEYQASDEDTYTDQTLSVSADWNINSRMRTALSAGIEDAHEQRGTGFSQSLGNQIAAPERFIARDISGLVGYGPDSSRLRFEITLGTNTKKYDGAENRQRDRGSDYGGISTYIAAGGKTELVAEIKQRRINYDVLADSGSQLDSRETGYLIGVDWQSAKTALKLRIGHLNKKFEDVEREAFSGPSWKATVEWKPLSYSTLALSTERKTDEMQGFGDYLNVITNSLGWAHQWGNHFSTDITYTQENRDVEGAVDVDRRQKLKAADLVLNYRVNYWLSFMAGIDHRQLESNNDSLDYQRKLTYIGFNVAI